MLAGGFAAQRARASRQALRAKPKRLALQRRFRAASATDVGQVQPRAALGVHGAAYDEHHAYRLSREKASPKSNADSTTAASGSR